MTLLRRLGYAAVTVAFLHIVFGAVVRISGSGMGCGVHWPKCYGYWFPPFTRPDLVIEVLHRYFAAALTTLVVGLFAVAARHRRAPGVGGPGGVLRASGLAAGLVVLAAGFGAVTVRFANAPWATVAHKAIAAALLASLATAVMRAGGFGGHRARTLPATPATARGTFVAAALAIVAVLLGGLTAKIPGAAVSCVGFPFCGEGSLGGGAQHVQLTHRVVAYLLALHLIGLAVAVTRRRERGPATVAVRVAAGVVLVQIALGASMVLFGFPPVVRSLHQATGIALWLTSFVAAYLARRGLAGPQPSPLRERHAPPTAPVLPTPAPGTPATRGSANPTIALFDRPPATATPGRDEEDEAWVQRAAAAAAMPRLVANGDPVRVAHGPGGQPRRGVPPALLPPMPRTVVHDAPVRRGMARESRRGRAASAQPFRVIDGRTRPTIPMIGPAGSRLLASGQAVDGALAFDLVHAGPEFELVVWSERSPVVGAIVPADAAASPGARLLRRMAAAYAAVTGRHAGVESPVVDAGGGVDAATADGAPAGDAIVAAGATLPWAPTDRSVESEPDPIGPLVEEPETPAVDSPVVEPGVSTPVDEPSIESPLEAPARETPAEFAVSDAPDSPPADGLGGGDLGGPVDRALAVPQFAGADQWTADADTLDSAQDDRLLATASVASLPADVAMGEAGAAAAADDAAADLADGAPTVAALRRARRYSAALLVARGAGQ